MKSNQVWALLGTLVLVLAACGPAAAPTATPRASATTTPQAKATPAPTAVVAKSGGTLKYRRMADPEGWDPRLYTMTEAMNIYTLTYERLWEYFNGAPMCQIYPLQGGLAESWSWKDDTTLEVKVRSGVRFQGGGPAGARDLEAEDVALNMKDVFTRQSYVKLAGDKTQDVVALDKNTVRFTLKQPLAGYVEEGMGPQHVVMVAREMITPGRKWAFEDHLGTGSGPFILKQYLPGTKVEFEKNPNYYRKGLPYLDGITSLIVPDDSTAVGLARAGQLDVVDLREAPAALEDARKTAPQLAQQSCPGPGSPVIFWRTDKPPFNDVRLRRALSMAIDRESFNKTVWLGHGFARPSPVHSMLSDWAIKPEELSAEVRQYVEYHPDRAKALIQQAYPQGLNVKFTYTLGYGRQFQQVAEALSAYWADVGVKVTLDAMERGAYATSVMTKRDYDDVAVSFAYSDTINSAVYQYFQSAMPQNRSRVNDPELDKMLASQLGMTNEKERMKLVKDIQVRLIDNQYILTLPMVSRAVVAQPYVKGLTYKVMYSTSELLRFTWLDK